MRILAFLIGFLAVAGMWIDVADARLLISISKSTQQMTVSIDGRVTHVWDVSTGRANYGTPTGVFKPQRMERSWFSAKYYNSPMPYSIFFYHGYAIHGSYEISRLGGPASHGCVRLHPQNAAALFGLVREYGPAATTILVTGENRESHPSARVRTDQLVGPVRGRSFVQRRSFPQPYEAGDRRGFEWDDWGYSRGRNW